MRVNIKVDYNSSEPNTQVVVVPAKSHCVECGAPLDLPAQKAIFEGESDDLCHRFRLIQPHICSGCNTSIEFYHDPAMTWVHVK